MSGRLARANSHRDEGPGGQGRGDGDEAGSSSWSLPSEHDRACGQQEPEDDPAPRRYEPSHGAIEAQRGARRRQFALGDEGGGAADRNDRAVVRLVTAHCRGDLGTGAVPAEFVGHREAVHIEELDIEQDEIGLEAPDGLERRGAVGSLADDLEDPSAVSSVLAVARKLGWSTIRILWAIVAPMVAKR